MFTEYLGTYFYKKSFSLDIELFTNEHSTWTKPALGPNCMIPYIKTFLYIWYHRLLVIQFGPKRA